MNHVTAAGQNFGWDDHEGPCDESCGGTIEPVTGYTHGDDDDIFFDDPDIVPAGPRSIWVGDPYAPGDNDRYEGMLTDRLLWGGFCMGFVRALHFDAEGIVDDVNVAHVEHVSSVKPGPDGYLYATSFGLCETVDLSEPPPARMYRIELSEAAAD